MLAGGCLVSAQESAGVLCTVQVSSRSLCVTIRDNTPSGHQSQVGCKCLHTASSHCSLLLYPGHLCSGATSESPQLVQAWCEVAPDLAANCPSLHCQHLCLCQPLIQVAAGHGEEPHLPVQPPHPGVAAAGGGHLQRGPGAAVPLIPGLRPHTERLVNTQVMQRCQRYFEV